MRRLQARVAVCGPRRTFASATLFLKQSQSTDKTRLQAVAQYAHAFAAVEGRRPRILLCAIGDSAEEKRDDHFATAMADLGFDVDVGPARQTPAQIARQAVEADVHGIYVGVRSADGAAALPRLLECLRQNAADDIFVAAASVGAPTAVPPGVVSVKRDDFGSTAETFVRLLQSSGRDAAVMKDAQEA